MITQRNPYSRFAHLSLALLFAVCLVTIPVGIAGCGGGGGGGGAGGSAPLPTVVDTITVSQSAPLALKVGETSQVSATPLSNGIVVPGASVDWVSLSESIVDFNGGPRSGTNVTLRAVGVGSTKVTVASGNVTREIEVNVTAATNPPVVTAVTASAVTNLTVGGQQTVTFRDQNGVAIPASSITINSAVSRNTAFVTVNSTVLTGVAAGSTTVDYSVTVGGNTFSIVVSVTVPATNPPSSNNPIEPIPSGQVTIGSAASATTYFVTLRPTLVSGATSFVYEVRRASDLSLFAGPVTTGGATFTVAVPKDVPFFGNMKQRGAGGGVLKSTDVAFRAHNGKSRRFCVGLLAPLPAFTSVPPLIEGEFGLISGESEHTYDVAGAPMAADGAGAFFFYTAVASDEALQYKWNAFWVHDGTQRAWASGANFTDSQVGGWVDGVFCRKVLHTSDPGSDFGYNNPSTGPVTGK